MRKDARSGGPLVGRTLVRQLTALAGGALLAALAAQAAYGSDIDKERRWAEQILPELFDGEPVWLSGDDGEFLALYAAPRAELRGGALVMHGIGVHPDWPQVINPLRVALAESDWATLSLQMPILANDAAEAEYAALLDEVPARIEAGIEVLRQRGAEPVVAIGHSMGASMTNHYLAHHPDSPIVAFVGIGMSARREGGATDNAALLSRIDIPVLDLYGENDLESVVASAAARAAAGAANAAYHQMEAAGANHFFDGREALLIDLVRAWLGRITGS